VKTIFGSVAPPCLVAFCLAVAGGPAVAGVTTVTVHDRDGEPVADVAVHIGRQADSDTRAAPETRAVMDQVNKRFVPHVLVVQTGTLVEFPNSDPIAHHVYSFSHPNHFKLPIYKGNAHAPVRFDEAGIVILGCNIHDSMLAYIVVVDSPVFGKTDVDGKVLLDGSVRPGDRISIWSPRIRDDESELSVVVEGDGAERAIAFRLEKNLRPQHREETEALSWSEY
jgi:plastocyanin